jgi:hypothetical protein
MAKDRTRNSRRREPERAGVSLLELVRWAIEQLGDGFADAAQRAEKPRRLTDGHD